MRLAIALLTVATGSCWGLLASLQLLHLGVGLLPAIAACVAAVALSGLIAMLIVEAV